MPSGGAIFAAAAVLLLSGYGRRLSAAAGLTPANLAAWCLLAAGLSVVRLVPPRLAGFGWEPLVDPAGTLLPPAFLVFMVLGPGGRGRPAAADVAAALAGVLGGATLAGVLAWGSDTGNTALLLPVSLVVGLALGPGQAGGASRLALVAAGAALWACTAGSALMAAGGWAAWPPAVGGGEVLAAGACAAVVAAGTASWRLTGPVRPTAPRSLRGAVPERR
jgi:hypothetical protein